MNISGGLASAIAGLGLALGLFARTGREEPREPEPPGDERPATSTTERNVRTILEIFREIEHRDPARPRQLQHVRPDVEFHWPPALPYGGTFRGRDREGPTWASTWNSLQPTSSERRMDPRIVGARGDEVVVLYHQRGLAADGARFDGEVLGLYRFRDGELSRAQMFYFDEAALVRFLEAARRAAGGGDSSEEPARAARAADEDP
jgi:ketosteroid isomerase-like protein